jgi:PadR family transcriptional regulator PadR
MGTSPLKGNLELLLLAVLRPAPLHGYAIITALRDRSAGEFDLAEGTIYPALHRLEEAGFVRSAVALANGRRRRVYELTAKGRREFAAQRTSWLHFARGVEAIVGGI